jgi:hypothetical protein
MSSQRTPLTISLKPWFQDHCFGGRVIFPAVETMLLLGAHAVEAYPQVDIRVMENVRFAKFLEIPPETATLDGLVECEVESDGRVRVKLLSRVQFKAMSRIKEHGEVSFSPPGADSWPNLGIDPLVPKNAIAEVDVEHLYRELVPFGPNYHTLQGRLYLSEHEAWGRLKAPDLPIDPIQKIIGSPFPLDGALHAACVLGQQSVDFVPFPVGFNRRTISRPTQPGCSYNTRVVQRGGTKDELLFDLIIFDKDGELYETTTGVRMRDMWTSMRT